MKTSQTILSAVIFAGLLSSSALANVIVSPVAPVPVKYEAPAPASVVSPTGLPSSYVGKTVRLTLTIDAAGQAHDIKVMSDQNRTLTKSLVTAVSKWQFTPARKNGVAVSAKVELPLELVES